MYLIINFKNSKLSRKKIQKIILLKINLKN